MIMILNYVQLRYTIILCDQPAVRCMRTQLIRYLLIITSYGVYCVLRKKGKGNSVLPCRFLPNILLDSLS